MLLTSHVDTLQSFNPPFKLPLFYCSHIQQSVKSITEVEVHHNYQVECIWTTGQEGWFGKESKQDVYLLKDPCDVLTLIILTAGLKNPDTTKAVHLGSIVEEPTDGKTELWVRLGSPDCSGPNTLILSSRVWGFTWACTLQGASTTKHKTIFKRNATNVFIHIFSVLEEKKQYTYLTVSNNLKKKRRSSMGLISYQTMLSNIRSIFLSFKA